MSWMRKPLPGSIEEAALKIGRLMELEEQQRSIPQAPRAYPARPGRGPHAGLLAAMMTPRAPAPYAASSGATMPRSSRASLLQSPLRGPFAADVSSASAPQYLASAQSNEASASPSPAVPPNDDALGHYLFGDGSPRSISIGDLTLNAPVALAQFPGVQAILSGQNVGTFPIDENADFKVVDGEYGGVLGGVSVNLKGKLTVRPNGTYDFVGDYGIEPDVYDFDPKEPGQRDWWAEGAVRAMDILHDWGIGTPYENQIAGRMPVRERGGR